MATDRNPRIRMCANNFGALTSQQISVKSELAAFPFTNAINPFRSRVYKPSGNFTIGTTNYQIYINDGADKTISITQADYATPALLATEIQTQLNASSANWTVAYDSSGGTYRFTISNSGSVTIRLSQTTDAIWDTIGYQGNTDLTGTSFEADEQRNHTDETIVFDLGHNATIDFFAMIAPLDEVFTISNSATVKLQGSNLNQWDSPPVDLTLTITDRGIMRFLDDLDDTAYRFWRIRIIDKFNTGGPEGISIGHIYLGDYITTTTRNASSGFDRTDFDPSQITESESGVLHFDKKTPYGRLGPITLALLSKTEKDTLEAEINKVETTTPFYLSLDPTLCTTDDIFELTRYVVFDKKPRFSHVYASIYTISFSAREVV